MKRREAAEMLDCTLAGLAVKLNITTAAVARWGDDTDIPLLRELQVKAMAKEQQLNVSDANLNHMTATQND